MAVPKLLQWLSGQPAMLNPVQTSAGASSAGAVPALNSSGLIDSTMLPVSAGGSPWLYKYVQTTIQAGDTVATATPTAFASQAVIPANTLAVGSVIELFASGIMSTDSNSWDNCNFKILLNGATVAYNVGGTYEGSALSNVAWRVRFMATVRAIGTSGAIMWEAEEDADTNPYGASSGGFLLNTPTSNFTLDTTVDQALTLWAGPNAGTTVSSTQQQCIVKVY